MTVMKKEGALVLLALLTGIVTVLMYYFEISPLFGIHSWPLNSTQFGFNPRPLNVGFNSWPLNATQFGFNPRPLTVGFNSWPLNATQFGIRELATANRKPKHGYILSLVYSGQQGAGVRALASQQCWVESFGLPMHIVEPFLLNTVLTSFSENSLKLSDYFDFDHYNKASLSKGYGTLATWEDFLENGSRNVVLVRMKKVPRNLKPVPEVLWSTDNSKKQCKKDIDINNLIWPKYVREKMLELFSHNFCLVKVVIAHYTYRRSCPFTAEEMYSAIFGKWKPENVTIVFTIWRAPFYIENPEPENPRNCQRISGYEVMLQPSQQLLKHANDYEELFLKPRTSIAVMLRAEHVLWKTGNGTQKLTLDLCLQEAINLTQSLQKRFSSGRTFVTADVGKFASSSWNQTFHHFDYSTEQRLHVNEAVQGIVNALYNHTWSFEEWENSFHQVTGAIHSKGYTAALQRLIACRAECLILVGGGHFQMLALHDYQENHPDHSRHCIHTVCPRNAMTVNGTDNSYNLNKVP